MLLAVYCKVLPILVFRFHSKIQIVHRLGLASLLISHPFTKAYIAGMTTRVRIVEETITPTIGVAILFITSEPAP